MWEAGEVSHKLINSVISSFILSVFKRYFDNRRVEYLEYTEKKSVHNCGMCHAAFSIIYWRPGTFIGGQGHLLACLLAKRSALGGGGRKAFLPDILYLKILKRMVQEFKNIQNL